VANGVGVGQVLLKILRRMALLLALGVVYNGFLKSDWTNAADFRYFSVLGKIGIAWGVAALVYVHTGLKGRLVAIAAGLLGYAALLYVVAPDAPWPRLTMDDVQMWRMSEEGLAALALRTAEENVKSGHAAMRGDVLVSPDYKGSWIFRIFRAFGFDSFFPGA